MKRIDISTKKRPNRFALVDDEDYDYINSYRWTMLIKSNTCYAHRSALKGKRKCTRMHRLIMDAPDGVEVDHKDGNGLNNQKSNLRLCNHQQNSCNLKPRSNNKSGFKGVYWDSSRNRWRVQIAVSGKKTQLGRYFCLMEAARVYDKAAMKYHGEFANLNFPKVAV